MGSRQRALRSLVMVIAVVATGWGTPAARAADAVAPAPVLFVADAPLTRNSTVQLAFVTSFGGQPNGGPVATYVASNDGTVAGGLLVNGSTVTESGPWALAAGPDGPRTIYGQVQYETGLWSPVAELDLVLDVAPASTLSMDIDYGSGLWSDGVDWHRVSTTPDVSLFARGPVLLPAAVNDAVRVTDGTWSLDLVSPGEAIAAGTWQVDPMPGTGDCVGFCAVVAPASGIPCAASSGTVTITEVSFTPEGDLDTLDADFALVCGTSGGMAGSVRYGVARSFRALEHSVEQLPFDVVTLGETAPKQTIVFINTGSTSVTFGSASLNGDAVDDFAIASDTCSGKTVAVSDGCSVGITFTPSVIGPRAVQLIVPDNTPSGRRSIRVIGFGRVQTTAVLDVTPPVYGPATGTIAVTVSPPGAPGPSIMVGGVQQFLGPCATSDPDPGHRTYTCHPTFAPGAYDVEATIASEGFYLGSAATPEAVDVGIATTLELSTATDDGVATGETATLRATLRTGSAIPGGTLRFRDEANAIIATAAVSGVDPTLDVVVTRPEGTHAFSAEYAPPSSAVQAASDAYDLVVVTGARPTTTMASTVVRTTAFGVTSAFSSPDTGVTFECRVDASDWYACTSPGPFLVGWPGSHTIAVRAVGASGLKDRTPATRTWIVDLDAPTATTPAARLLAARTMFDGQFRVRIGWSGADATSGVATYDLARSVDGGSWTTLTSSLTTPSHDRWLRPGHSYRFRVRPVDRAGNVGDWSYGPTFRLTGIQQTSSRIGWSGTWTTRSLTGAWGGSVRASSDGGARASISVTARTVAWVSTTGPGRGVARVYVDGVLAATVDLRGATLGPRRVVWSRSWSSAGTHRITVRVSGTSGRPRVDIDGFAWTN